MVYLFHCLLLHKILPQQISQVTTSFTYILHYIQGRSLTPQGDNEIQEGEDSSSNHPFHFVCKELCSALLIVLTDLVVVVVVILMKSVGEAVDYRTAFHTMKSSTLNLVVPKLQVVAPQGAMKTSQGSCRTLMKTHCSIQFIGL